MRYWIEAQQKRLAQLGARFETSQTPEGDTILRLYWHNPATRKTQKWMGCLLFDNRSGKNAEVMADVEAWKPPL